MIQKPWYAGHGLLRYVLSGAVMVVFAACGTDSGPGQVPEAANAPVPVENAASTSMPKDLRAAYIASVQREASESYAAVAMDGLVQFENAAQRFVATVDRNGLSVTPNEDAWHLGMRTVAVGCEGAMLPITDAVPEVIGNRSEVHRDGLEEWYLNGPLGVEQGFVLNEAPACAGPKRIALAIDGDLTANLDDADGDGRGDAVRFADDEGRAVASYTDLFVTDATGKTVPAWLSVNAGEMGIVVDDAGAVYPLAIDPLIAVEQAKLTANDGVAEDAFGVSVALSGDTAAVGQYNASMGQGSAYVFVRNGTTWTQQAKLTASDVPLGDYFGHSVALSGNTAVVGAYRDDIGAKVGQGSAYVFVRSGTTWTQQAKLTASDGATYDFFGQSVSLLGDMALVGAPSDIIGGNGDLGSAYVFVRSGTTWTQQAKLTANDGVAEDAFGRSVSLSGDTALVGAMYDDIGANTNQGSAYVFVRSGTTWTQQAKLTASDGEIYDQFGGSVSLSADTALVGARYDTLPGGASQGSAYVFVRSGTTWTTQAKLTASNGATYDYFGYSVALSGDTALVGAGEDYEFPSIGINQGSAYVFTRNGVVWTQQAQIMAIDNEPDNHFGGSLSLTDDTALIGAPGDNAGTNVDQGSAYVFVLYGANGSLCATGTECASGSCVDGVCCNTACGGGDPTDCQACSVAAGAAMNGTCAPLTIGTVCRASGGACDVAESCDGVMNNCPADIKMAAGIECRAAGGACDVAESCDGALNNCPADAKIAAGTECRSTMGPCDVAETCDGNAAACPMDAVADVTTECRPPVGVCDIAEKCDGVTKACTPDLLAPVGAMCRASANACDIGELCTGISVDCPADGHAPDGTTCTGGTCAAGTCSNGSGGAGGESASSSSSSGQPGNDPPTDGGCACRVGASPSSDTGFGASALALLGLVALTSRRRSQLRLKSFDESCPRHHSAPRKTVAG